MNELTNIEFKELQTANVIGCFDASANEANIYATFETKTFTLEVEGNWYGYGEEQTIEVTDLKYFDEEGNEFEFFLTPDQQDPFETLIFEKCV